MQSEGTHKKILSLSDDVKAAIRTGVALTSFAQAVEELVLNSIDAGATSVAVRVDLPYFKIQVVDNGSGISFEQFSSLGQRYSTSKCHTVQDLENLRYFGYRGEAMASLAATSSFMEITSRTVHSRLTYTKPFHNGKPQALIQADVPRPCTGTTVTAFDLFHNMPVRRKRLNEALEMEAIRYRLSGLALMWPRVSFSLRDDSAGNVILQTHKCSGVAATFSNIFTPARARKLMEIEGVQDDEFKISGLVSIEGYSRKDLQFVFVNKRLVLKSSIHKQVNKILGRSLILKRKGLVSDIAAKLPTFGEDINKSPTKQGDKYGIFVISIECPYKAYDITFDPSKTLVEFRNWPKLIHLLQEMLYPFLRKHNLLAFNEYMTPLLPSYLSERECEAYSEDASSESSEPIKNQALEVKRTGSQLLKYGRNICVTDTQNGILSKAVCRPKTTEQSHISSKSDLNNSKASIGAEKNLKVCNSDDDLSLLETPLRIGKTDDIHSIVQTSGKRKEKHTSNLTEDSCHRDGEPLQEADSVSCKTLSGITMKHHQPRCSRIIENSPECEYIGLSKEHPRKVRFNSLENKVHLPSAPLQSVEFQPSSKRKEITLSTDCYSSSLRRLREANLSKDGSSQRSKVQEIMTDSLQQLRKSARQAISELGDLYKTPERFTSCKKSSHSCDYSDDPIGAKHARTEVYCNINNDAEDSEDMPGICGNKYGELNHMHQAAYSGKHSLNLALKKSEEHITQIRDTNQYNGQIGLCEANSQSLNNKRDILTTEQKKKPIKNVLLYENVQSNARHTVSCPNNSGSFSLDTDRQKIDSDNSRSLLRPMKATLSCEKFSELSSSSKEDFHMLSGTNTLQLKLKRKSPKKLSHSGKLAKLMRGKALDEEGSGKSKPKALLRNFQYRKNMKNEKTSEESGVPKQMHGTYGKPLKQLKELNELDSTLDFKTSSPTNHQGETFCKTSILNVQYENESQIQTIRENYHADWDRMSVRNGKCFAKASKQEMCTHQNFEPQQFCSSPSSSNKKKKSVHCCQCIYSRNKSRQHCNDCSNSFCTDQSLPFVSYKLPENVISEKSSPKVSLVLSLPIVHNHSSDVVEETCGKKMKAKHDISCPQVYLPYNKENKKSSPGSITETSDGSSLESNISGRSEGFNSSLQQTPILIAGKQEFYFKAHLSDNQSQSPHPFVSQGFSVSNEAVSAQNSFLETNEVKNYENCSVSAKECNSKENVINVSEENGCQGNYFVNDHCNSGMFSARYKTVDSDLENECAPFKSDAFNEHNLIAMSGTESDIFFQAPNCEHLVSSDCSSDILIEQCHAHENHKKDFVGEIKADTTCTATEKKKAPESSGDILSSFHYENVSLQSLKGTDADSDGIELKSHEPQNSRASKSKKPSNVDSLVTNSGIKKVVNKDLSLRSVSETKSSYFLPEIDLKSKILTQNISLQFVDSVSSVRDTNVLITETLSQSVGTDKFKADLITSSIMVTSVPETESLKYDECQENTLSSDSPLIISDEHLKLGLSSAKKSNVSSHINSNSPNDAACEKNTVLISENCPTHSFIQKVGDVHGSQEASYSLSLAQKSCNTLEALKDDTDSFPFFSKPLLCDSSADLVNNRHDSNKVAESYSLQPFVTEKSESLFDDSEKLLEYASKDNGNFARNLIDISSQEAYRIQASKNETINKNANLLIRKANNKLLEHKYDPFEASEGKRVYDEQLALCNTKDASQVDNQWSSGDQALLAVEMPDEDPMSQISQGCGDAENVCKVQKPIQKICGSFSSQNAMDVAFSNLKTMKTSEQPIAISVPQSLGIYTSSLSALRHQATEIRKSGALSGSGVEKTKLDNCDMPTVNDIDRGTWAEKQSDITGCIYQEVDKNLSCNFNNLSPQSCKTQNGSNNLNRRGSETNKDLKKTLHKNHDSKKRGTNPTYQSEDQKLAGKKGEKSMSCDDAKTQKEDTQYRQSEEKGPHMASWRQEIDALSGKTLYVNNQSGHTVLEDQWPEMSSQSLRALMTVKTNTGKEDTLDHELEGLSASGRKAVADVISSHVEEAEAEVYSKWRGGRDITYEKEAGMDVSTLLAKWNNPIYSQYKPPSLEAEPCPNALVAKSCFNALSMVEFTKDMLDRVKVIGQVDNKFIACEIKNKMKGSSSSLLVLLDQHAVHERIRVEYFTQECYVKKNNEKTDMLEKADLNPVQTIVMDQDDVRILKAFRREFNRIGVSFNLDATSRTVVHISSVPAILLEREALEVRRRRATNVEEKIECLIKEYIDMLKSTNGACGSFPLTVHKHVCSMACHGAVKFGDMLTLSECKDLLSALARCSLPFQCAHGRPSVAPIVNITALEEEIGCVKKKKPNLWKISSVKNQENPK